MGDAAYLPFLRQHRVTHVLNCAAEAQPPPFLDDAEAGIKYLCFPWRDSAEQGRLLCRNDFTQLRQASRFVRDVRAQGGRVLVHCVQGISRSAAVVVAFLMEWEPQLGMQEAVATVRSKHPVACRPFPFQEMLRSFQYFLDGLRRRPEEQSAPAELDVRKAS